MGSQPPWRLRGLPRTRMLGFEIPAATTLRARLLGLSLLTRARAGAGLLIPHCRSVHTFGMRFALDLVFLDAEGRVVDLRREVGPGRVVRCAAAAEVLELPSPQAHSAWGAMDRPSPDAGGQQTGRTS